MPWIGVLHDQAVAVGQTVSHLLLKYSATFLVPRTAKQAHIITNHACQLVRENVENESRFKLICPHDGVPEALRLVQMQVCKPLPCSIVFYDNRAICMTAPLNEPLYERFLSVLLHKLSAH